MEMRCQRGYLVSPLLLKNGFAHGKQEMAKEAPPVRERALPPFFSVDGQTIVFVNSAELNKSEHFLFRFVSISAPIFFYFSKFFNLKLWFVIHETFYRQPLYLSANGSSWT